MKKLDIGCGKNKIPNADGIDMISFLNVKYVHDLNIYPYPIKSNSYDEIYCYHILEHVNDMVKTMQEIHRIGKKNAKVYIRGPHCSCSSTVWIDPTHKRGLSLRMFTDYFTSEGIWSYYSNLKFQIDKLKLHYVLSQNRFRIPVFISSLLSSIANLNRFSQELCERLWAGWVGGFEEIEVVLKIQKK